jgi:NADP-dependent 3-hydroxy acid dehydrogenase YdfG
MMSTNSANWVLVTGTSSGIGRAATFTLAENGYRVLAAVRKQEDVEDLRRIRQQEHCARHQRAVQS